MTPSLSRSRLNRYLCLLLAVFLTSACIKPDCSGVLSDVPIAKVWCAPLKPGSVVRMNLENGDLRRVPTLPTLQARKTEEFQGIVVFLLTDTNPLDSSQEGLYTVHRNEGLKMLFLKRDFDDERIIPISAGDDRLFVLTKDSIFAISHLDRKRAERIGDASPHSQYRSFNFVSGDLVYIDKKNRLVRFEIARNRETISEPVEPNIDGLSSFSIVGIWDESVILAKGSRDHFQARGTPTQQGTERILEIARNIEAHRLKQKGPSGLLWRYNHHPKKESLVFDVASGKTKTIDGICIVDVCWIESKDEQPK